MNKGDVLVMSCDTRFSNYISRYTGSPWTHVALMGSEGKLLDYNFNGRRKNTLDELIEDPCVRESIIAVAPLHVDVSKMVYEAEERFEESRYDHIAILRLIPKLLNQRDGQNIHLFRKHFTCSSLIARSAGLASEKGVAFNHNIHYSQTIPDDFATYWRTYRL